MSKHDKAVKEWRILINQSIHSKVLYLMEKKAWTATLSGKFRDFNHKTHWSVAAFTCADWYTPHDWPTSLPSYTIYEQVTLENRTKLQFTASHGEHRKHKVNSSWFWSRRTVKLRQTPGQDTGVNNTGVSMMRQYTSPLEEKKKDNLPERSLSDEERNHEGRYLVVKSRISTTRLRVMYCLLQVTVNIEKYKVNSSVFDLVQQLRWDTHTWLFLEPRHFWTASPSRVIGLNIQQRGKTA